MVIREITAEAVLAQCRKVVGVPEPGTTGVEDVLIASLLRRVAGYLTPCSRSALRASIVDCLKMLGDESDMVERVERAIDWLLVGGDLLELNDVTVSDLLVKGTWVFPSPPGYIVRPSGSVFIVGTVPDQDNFLPSSIASRVKHEGLSRVIQALPGEDLSRELSAFGLRQIPERVWLKTPREEALETMLASYKQLLQGQGPSGEIAGLVIIDPVSPVRYYKGRWTSPKASHSGLFVGRRPQEFGAPIWGLVQLERGSPIRFLDLPLRQRSRWKGSDEAWHVQMAIDRSNATPQRYRRITKADGVRFDFFSPLPSWTQRRFMLFGHSVPPEKCLMSFLLSNDEAKTEEQFLTHRLWLSATEDSV